MNSYIHLFDFEGRPQLIRPNIHQQLIDVQNEWCLLGQRVLLICKKKCNLEKEIGAENSISELQKYVHQSNDFCIIGMVGLIDPPREGISDVIAKFRAAGIRFLMITGDYALTAAVVAVQIGILTESQYDTLESMRIRDKRKVVRRI